MPFSFTAPFAVALLIACITPWCSCASIVEPVQCPELNNYAGNGQVFVTNYNPGGIANYTCNPGYDLVGPSIRTCLSTGDWSGRAPTCHEPCPTLTSPTSGEIYFTLSSNGRIVRAEYSCNHGYRQSTGSSSVRHCSLEGKWSGIEPTCEQIQCPPVSDPTNGQVNITSYTVGGKASYSCNSGFRLSGLSTRTCASRGSWSGFPPGCYGISCPFLGYLFNGQVSVSSHSPGGIATYTCNSGFYLYGGSSTRSCSSSGAWSGSQPYCIGGCLTLTNPSNGQVSVSSYLPGGTAIYSCNSGYELSGLSTLNCSSSRNWSGPAPSCLEIQCPSLSAPSNGQVSLDSSLVGGTLASFFCNSGYWLSGSQNRTCSSDGTWSGLQPSCLERVEGCSIEDYGAINLINQTQQDTIKNIANSIISVLSLNESEPTLEGTLNALIDQYSFRHTQNTFDRFSEAVTDIAAAESSACSSSTPPTIADVPRIAREFAEKFMTTSRDRDVSSIRSLHGTMLCIEKGLVARRRKRQDCVCPVGGFPACTTPCEFYGCLDPGMIETVFGFTDLTIYPCLAFAIDTTGSMGEEITTARRITLEFIHAEEDFTSGGSYMLVPFNDIGPDHANVPDESVGPISYADSNSLTDLQNLRNSINSLSASGGGDGPEYCLDAILEALDFEDTDDYGDSFPVMEYGSQMVVITDAPSKNEHLRESVISKANEKGVCIHFFLSNSPDRDGVYQLIADRTEGTLINSFSAWNLADFILSYRTNECYSVEKRRKRSAAIPVSSLNCKNFRVSRFSSILRLSLRTSLQSVTVTLTSPSGAFRKTISSSEYLGIYRNELPEAGQWSACAASGTIEDIIVDRDISLDATVFYINEFATASSAPPIECTAGRTMIATSKASLFGTARIALLNAADNVVQTATATKCSDGLFVNMSYPKGTYKYEIIGTDTLGSPVEYKLRHGVTFNTGEYSLNLDSDKASEIGLLETVNVTVIFSNKNSYSSTFSFSGSMDEFLVQSFPTQTLVPPKRSVKINLTAVSASTSVKAGSAHTMTIEASNGCTIIRTTKPVMIKAAPSRTPPPADVCGCQNGGTCTQISRRGRVFNRCQCPSGYRGSKCQHSY